MVIRRRGRPRFRKNRDRTYLDWIKWFPCVVCGRTPCDPAHVKSRGAGGPDLGNVIPLCRDHHTEQGTMGIDSFQAKYALDMPGVAQNFGRMYQNAQKGPQDAPGTTNGVTPPSGTETTT